MNVHLDAKTKAELAALAEAEGKSPEVKLSELVHEAASARKANGAAKPTSEETDPAYEPSKTELGRKLRALRRKYVESGQKLLTVDEINAEVAQNRGER